jgi:hypothetical protein
VRALRTTWILAGLLLLLGLSARSASATTTTYDLVQGNLTAVTVGFDQTDRLAADVSIDAASVTVDFDPAVFDLNNLFIAATGPGTVSLSGINGWDSVVFSNASLQSLSISDITPSSTPGTFNFGTPVQILSDLALTNAFGTTVINDYLATSGATGSILLAPNGLDISLNGVVLGFLPDPVNPNLSQLVKADFNFTARNVDGARAIPEPGSQLLFPAGLALLGWALRIRR